MSWPGNNVNHSDRASGSARHKRRKRQELNSSMMREHNSSATITYSTKTPSIIGLENLRLHPSDQYTVDIVQPQGNGYRPGTMKAPIQAFQAHPGTRREGRNRTTVYTTIVFMKIGQIETIKEYFEAEIYIQARWREPVLDKTQTVVTDFTQFWNPELVIQNLFEEPKEKKWSEVRYSAAGEAYIYEMRRTKGKFFETMELNHFPFDIQTMSVTLTSELDKGHVHLVEDTEELSCVHVEGFTDTQEWTLHNFVDVSNIELSSQYSRGRGSFPGFVVSGCASRRPGFFGWNVLVIVNLLNIFAFTTFAVEPKLTPNRLQLSFILVLASISFRFVTNQSIPKISYLTHLDRYVLTSMLFSGLITGWHAILSRFSYDSELQDRMDWIVFIIIAVVFFFFNITFITVIMLQRRNKLQDIHFREKTFANKARARLGADWDRTSLNTAQEDLNFAGKIKKKLSHTRMR